LADPDLALCHEIVHLIQVGARNSDVRRVDADAMLLELVEKLLRLGRVALYEEDAIEGYRVAGETLDRVLRRIARDADRVG
jgi:hypothetical protein